MAKHASIARKTLLKYKIYILIHFWIYYIQIIYYVYFNYSICCVLRGCVKLFLTVIADLVSTFHQF